MCHAFKTQEDTQSRKEIDKLREQLHENRDQLYAELRSVKREKEEVELKSQHVRRLRNYMKKQERRLLSSTTITIILLVMWVSYVELGNAQFGNVVWFSSAGILGLLLVSNLTLYILDRFDVKEDAKHVVSRGFVYMVMSPVYLVRGFWWLVKGSARRSKSKRKNKT